MGSDSCHFGANRESVSETGNAAQERSLHPHSQVQICIANGRRVRRVNVRRHQGEMRILNGIIVPENC